MGGRGRGLSGARFGAAAAVVVLCVGAGGGGGGGAGGGGDGGARRSELFDQETSSASAHQIRDYFSRLIRRDSPEPSWAQTIAEHAKQDAVHLSVLNRPPHSSPPPPQKEMGC